MLRTGRELQHFVKHWCFNLHIIYYIKTYWFKTDNTIPNCVDFIVYCLRTCDHSADIAWWCSRLWPCRWWKAVAPLPSFVERRKRLCCHPKHRLISLLFMSGLIIIIGATISRNQSHHVMYSSKRVDRMSRSTESKQRTYRVGRLPHHASGLMPGKCHSALAPFMLSNTLINSVEGSC